MALTPGTRLGGYQIIAPLGAGGMGEVYLARDTRLDRTIALKVVSKSPAAGLEASDRFEREAKAIAKLNHPNICAIYDGLLGNRSGLLADEAQLLAVAKAIGIRRVHWTGLARSRVYLGDLGVAMDYFRRALDAGDMMHYWADMLQAEGLDRLIGFAPYQQVLQEWRARKAQMWKASR